MADGNLVRQSQNGKDSVVFGPSVYDVPLLPYERELIKTVGITEEEYRFFTAEVKRRGKLRPAEYAHIPDVRNDVAVTPILINLAISLVLTGVAYLLSPKPKMPSAAKKDGGGTIDTGDVNGANRFTPSRGFETLATLADYAAPIPIIFGRYDSREKKGGMLTTPKLVWSRMFSEGTNQRAQLLFVVGEQGENNGIKKPDLEGIFLGNNVLDSVFKDFYAFYWKRDSSDDSNRRIRATDKAYGTNNGAATGDPLTTTGEVFICPTPDGPKQVAFCHAFSPANNTEFGVYDPIANGTGYRLNYEIISIPVDQTEDAKRTQTLARVKIAGDNNEVRRKGGSNGDRNQINQVARQGQQGMGRNYSPRMGIIRLERTKSGGVETASSSDLRKTVASIRNGDVAQFRICRESIDDDLYLVDGKGESVSDINSAVLSAQFAADDAMRLGEQFQIGGCIWKVTSRTRPRFDPEEGKDQAIELTCIDTDLSLEKKIGVVSLASVLEPKDGYIGDTFEDSDGPQTIGEAFWPITKVAIGVVRNNRPAIATEIGIKSTVFQNLKGLCAFSGLPSISETNDYDEDNLQVKTGRINSYIVRTSVFRVFVRQVGSSNSAFNLIPMFFAIRGHRPVAQYTFIRFENLDLGEAELEFKFAQLSGSELRGLNTNTNILDMSEPGTKNARNSTTVKVNVPVIGAMNVTAPGSFIFKSEITANKEFFADPRTIAGSLTNKFPETVIKGDNRPEPIGGRSAVGILDKQKNIAFDASGNDPFVKGGKTGAFTYALYGDSDADSIRVGWSRTFRTTEYHNNNHEKWMVVAWKLRKDLLPNDHYAKVQNGQQTTWVVETAEIISSGPGFSKKRDQGNSVVDIKRGQDRTDILNSSSIVGGQYPATNPFVGAHPNGNMKSSGQRYNITDLEVIDTYHGRAQGYRYVLFGDARSFPVGTTKEITKSLTHRVDSSKKLRLKLKATVKTLDAGYQLNETIGWSIPKMTVVIDGFTTNNIQINDSFRETVNITASNPYRTVYDVAGVDYVVTSLKSVETDLPPSLEGSFKFAEQTQYTDISHYRDLVEKSNANSPEHQIVYVNEIQEYENEQPPVMNDLTLAGLSLKAGRNFSQLDQLRCWLAEGIPVERLHPNKQTAYEDGFATGPSNLLTDLVYYLLTNQMGGAGGLLGMTAGDPFLVDKPDMIDTSKFLYEQKLFFNGPITERTNLRQFIADVAPYFLCNFVVTDGKFSLKPAFPVNSLGQFNQGAVPIAQLFTEGNILEDSYKVEYLGGEERRTFQAIVRYRQENPNKLPEEKAVTVKGTGGGYSDSRVELLPQEQFDLTTFCTSEHHAVMVAKYFLSLRKLVTHTISFSTTLDGLNIAAGSYIKVATRSSPYSSARNGTINAAGAVTSLTDFADGQYRVSYFKADSEDVQDGVMTVSNKTVSESTFASSVFAMIDDSVSQNVYVVEQLTFSQEGTVDIVASEHPCFSDGRSKLVNAILFDSFKIF